MPKLKVSVVIPTYKSFESIPVLIESIHLVFGNNKDFNYEIICVDDCSPDGVWNLIVHESKKNSRVKGIYLSKNSGQHYATIIGLRYATGDYVVTIDDDLQYPPRYIPDLITAAVGSDADVVYGIAESRRYHKVWKNIGSRFNNLALSLILKKSFNKKISSFRLLKKELYLNIANMENSYVYIDAIVLQITTKIQNVPINLENRPFGNSTYSLGKSIRLFWLMLKSSFYTPKKMLSVTGISLALLGFVSLIFVFIGSLEEREWPSGWASLFGLSLFAFGVQTYFLSLILSYVIEGDRRSQLKGIDMVQSKTGF